MAEKNGPVRVGLAGIGRAGWGMHCPELEARSDKFQIVAACDVIAERREEMRERFRCKTYARIRDLIDDPDVDLVDIATRTRDHFAHAAMALEAGKDVFLEKPMTRTWDEAKRLKRLADRSPGNLYIRHNRRFEPCFQHIREILESGILGEVFQFKLRRLGFGRRADWQTLKRYGGGMTMNWGSHIVDQGLQFLESPVKTIFSDIKRIAAVGDAEDHVKILLTGRNGRLVDIEVSGGAALVDEPVYMVWGTRGGLWSDENTIRLRYLDPRCPIPDLKVDSGTPAIQFQPVPKQPETPVKKTGAASPPFRSQSRPTNGTERWIEESLPVSPREKMNMTSIWDKLYETLREGEPFPIRMEQAMEVMRIVAHVTRR
ncbi:Gfo/Idh/MocA family oxidoreductase [bacterium]|nr:Gfo/Idh/MocA family oxidoreductase [bacterium]